MIIKTGFISQIALQVGEIQIYWYAVLIVFAMFLALVWCKVKDGTFGIKYENILDLSLFVFPISIICARIYYVLFEFENYKDNLMMVFNIRDGGLAIYGGLIGGAITIYIFCRIKKIHFLDVLDLLVPIVALGQAIGRWGNYINIEAYGTETNLPIKMEIIENGIVKYVHPTFLYESIVTFSLFIILSILMKKRKFKGEITYLYIIGYSFARFFIERLRIDSLMFYNFRISQILSLSFFVVFLVILSVNIYRCKKMSKKGEK